MKNDIIISPTGQNTIPLQPILEEGTENAAKQKNNNFNLYDLSAANQGEENKKEEPIMKDLIAENFVILTKIGKGAFGEISLSYNLRENIEVAIKQEKK